MDTTALSFSFTCVTCQASAVDGAYACPCGAFFHADCTTEGLCPSCGTSRKQRARASAEPAAWTAPLLTAAAVLVIAAGVFLL